MKRDSRVYIEDILESISLIEDYVHTTDREEFGRNAQIQDAVVRRLEIIGEATKNIPEDIKNRYPEIPWEKITGMRNVLIHEYFGMNIERVWKVVREDLPVLRKNIQRIKKELGND